MLVNAISDPFLAYQAHAVRLTIQSESSASGEVDEGGWSVLIDGLVSKLATFGVFPASYQVSVGTDSGDPASGPSSRDRDAIVILLPRDDARGDES